MFLGRAQVHGIDTTDLDSPNRPSPHPPFDVAELGRFAAVFFPHTIVEITEDENGGVTTQRHEIAAKEWPAGGSRSKSYVSRKDGARRAKVRL